MALDHSRSNRCKRFSVVCNGALTELTETIKDRPIQIAVVGGGAGGVEIAFCLPPRIRNEFPNVKFDLHLIHGGEQLLPGHRDATARRAADAFRKAGTQLHLGRRVVRIRKESVTLDDLQRGDELEIDLILWATSATAPDLLKELVLRRDDRDFLVTNQKLQSVSNQRIFAVGDSGTIENVDRPKSGVFAVRQGPILWQNLRRVLRGRPLLSFVPQTDFLKLINTGNRRAIGEHKGRTFEGRTSWWWKDRIDRRFMAMYQNYDPPRMESASKPTDEAAEDAMRCLGCGGKVGGGVLRRALAKLDMPERSEVKIGLNDPDDAAVLQFATGKPVVVTTDFFAAPLNDPYIVGRVAALNALSDVWAMGGSPTAALTIATIPFGSEKSQAEFLSEALAGSLEEFRAANTALVGGHTIEGPRFSLGYTIIGEAADAEASNPDESESWTKSALRSGDQLILTKPLGSGVVLAAAMRSACCADWYGPLLEHLTTSNRDAADIARQNGLRAVTDVTGFGLAGHLLEMLSASDMNASLDLATFPLLPGTEELIKQGIVSTLDTANRAAEEAIRVESKTKTSPRYTTLFDPQTCGGLLLAVPKNKTDDILAAIPGSTTIGEITGRAATSPTIKVT